MSEALLVTIGVGGVCVLVVFEVLKWVRAHQANSLVQAAEAKLPPAAVSVLTGDHFVEAVKATGAAVSQAVQAVATAPSLVQSLTGNGTPATPAPNVTPTPAGGDQGQSMMMNALLGSSTLKRPDVAPVPADDPTKRPPYPTYWRFNGTGPGEAAYPSPFPMPADKYTVDLADSSVVSVKLDGVEVSLLQPFEVAAGDHTASVVSKHEGPFAGTLQFRKHDIPTPHLPG